jgi:myo-inositol 2-dehydrogenase/D-chiro-inositol 1-dehydrogenase
MNVLILGDGAEELAWARMVSAHPDHTLRAAFPGFDEFPEVPEPADLDDALAVAGVDAVIVGGGLDFRGEALRRVAAAGLAAVCLHPPGLDSEAYYMVAMSRDETGAVIVPDLALRLHPGLAAMRQALTRGDLGAFRVLRHESPVGPEGVDLARQAFARMVDPVRAVLGEVEAVTATGSPPGPVPTEELVVQLRAGESRRAEVRVWSGPPGPSRLSAHGAAGTLTLEYDPAFRSPARLTQSTAGGTETARELGAWDPHAALLGALAAPASGGASGPTLLDGTRATELAEAVVRSLRRGRTVDMHYEEISESGTFKSVMTSLGCMLLLAILVVLPAALIGPALGVRWTVYLAYVIPPVLVAFVVLQALRLGIRSGDRTAAAPPGRGAGPE